MSNWTHVAGIIRVDGFRFDTDTEPDWESILGKELRYEDGYDKWEEAEDHPEHFMPLGSEGSLEKSIWTNPDKCCAAAYTVSIFGDLRDHDDPDAIIEWFKDICSKMFVRQAAITVKNEWNGMKTWAIDDEGEE
jgi:hypothetical protein